MSSLRNSFQALQKPLIEARKQQSASQRGCHALQYNRQMSRRSESRNCGEANVKRRHARRARTSKRTALVSEGNHTYPMDSNRPEILCRTPYERYWCHGSYYSTCHLCWYGDCDTRVEFAQVWLLAQHPIKWVTENGSVRITKLGPRYSLPLLGMVILLWLPLLFDRFGVGISDLPMDVSRYLPLYQGNSWTYKKTVPDGQRVFFWEAYGTIQPNGEGNFSWAHGVSPTIVPGESTETYLVVGQIQMIPGDTYWEISVSNATARDGRYGSYTKPEMVLWRSTLVSDFLVVLEEVLCRLYFSGRAKAERIPFARASRPTAHIPTVLDTD